MNPSRVDEKVQDRWDQLAKPEGSLGDLEKWLAQIGKIQSTNPPLTRPAAVLLFFGDHGVVAEDVSAYPSEVTAVMVKAVREGKAAINAFCDSAGIELIGRNVGSRSNFQWDQENVGEGTDNILRGRAMSVEEVEASVQVGRRTLRKATRRKELKIVGVGEIGIGNTTVSSTIIGSVLDVQAGKVVGPGSGLSEEGLDRKRSVVTEILNRRTVDPTDGYEILSAFGGFEVAALVGVMLEAHRRDVAVLLDGITTAAAGLCAELIEPEVTRVLLASHLSPEPGHRYVLEHFELEPMLDLRLRLGEGTGAALAFKILESANEAYREMAKLSDLVPETDNP